MARVVCPSCKTSFEAKISREDYALNCVTCGVAFNAAEYLPSDEYQAIREQQPGFQRAAESARVTQAPVLSDLPQDSDTSLRPAAPETRTAGLPFMNDSTSVLRRQQSESVREPSLTPIAPAKPPTSFFEASVTTSRFRPVRLAADQDRNPDQIVDNATESLPAISVPSSSGMRLLPKAEGARFSAPPPALKAHRPEAGVSTGEPVDPDQASPSNPDMAESTLSPVQGIQDIKALSTRQWPGPFSMPRPAPSDPDGRKKTCLAEREQLADRGRERSEQKKKSKLRPPILEGAFGPFDIISEIARGGVGAVFHGRERDTGRQVALKVLLEGEEAGEVERERFRRECETAKALALPGMVQIFAVGEVEGKPFMAMELVEGRSLDKLIREKPLSVNEGLVIMREVARTVGALHDAGYVHRDLKPGNILLDGFGAPKVADFGLVKSLDEVTRLTAAGLVCGTPAYMSPEQARGDSDDVGPRSDVWALGAVLYELLTGAPPFKADNALRLMHKITKETPTPPDQINPKVPKEVQAIVLKCLQKNLERRYPNAKDMASDIDRFLDGHPVEARSRRLQNIVKSVQEQKGFWIATAMGLAAVVLVGVLVRLVFAPQETGPLLERGWTALRGNQVELAQQSFREAIALEPGNARAHLGLGMVLAIESIDLAEKRVRDPMLFNEALRLTRRAGQLERSLSAEAEAQRARIYRSVGRREEAARMLERAVALNQTNPKYGQALGLAYWHLGRASRDQNRAEMYYKKALAEFENVLRLKRDYPKTREYIKLLRQRDLADRTNVADAAARR